MTCWGMTALCWQYSCSFDVVSVHATGERDQARNSVAYLHD